MYITDEIAPLNTHDGLSISPSLGSAPAGQEEVGTKALVLQMIGDLNELTSIGDTDTLRMFKPDLEQAHENITAMWTIAITYNS